MPSPSSQCLRQKYQPKGGVEAEAGAWMGGSNPGTIEGECGDKIIPVYEILISLLLVNSHNGFNNISSLAIMWTVCHW